MDQKAIPRQAAGQTLELEVGSNASANASLSDSTATARATAARFSVATQAKIWAPHYYDATTLMQPRLDPLLALSQSTNAEGSGIPLVAGKARW